MKPFLTFLLAFFMAGTFDSSQASSLDNEFFASSTGDLTVEFLVAEYDARMQREIKIREQRAKELEEINALHAFQKKFKSPSILAALRNREAGIRSFNARTKVAKK